MLKIGCDPELFVAKNGRFISGHIFKSGTKKNPKKTRHGAVQNDGLALEFNIPPAETEDAFVVSVQSMLKDIAEIVKKKDKRAKLIAQSCAPFDFPYLKRLPERVRELGCNPDFNAYTLEANPAPDAETPFRTGAGHIHCGWTENQDDTEADYFHECASFVRELDYFVGLPLLHLDPDDKRRELYGKAGAFRPKKYGLEYRVPSNVWVQKEEWQRLVYSQTKKAYDRWINGHGIVKTYRAFARDAINGNNQSWDKDRPEVLREIMS